MLSCSCLTDWLRSLTPLLSQRPRTAAHARAAPGLSLAPLVGEGRPVKFRPTLSCYAQAVSEQSDANMAFAANQKELIALNNRQQASLQAQRRKTFHDQQLNKIAMPEGLDASAFAPSRSKYGASGLAQSPARGGGGDGGGSEGSFKQGSPSSPKGLAKSPSRAGLSSAQARRSTGPPSSMTAMQRPQPILVRPSTAGPRSPGSRASLVSSPSPNKGVSKSPLRRYSTKPPALDFETSDQRGEEVEAVAVEPGSPASVAARVAKAKAKARESAAARDRDLVAEWQREEAKTYEELLEEREAKSAQGKAKRGAPHRTAQHTRLLTDSRLLPTCCR